MAKERNVAWREEIKDMSLEELCRELLVETGDWKRDCEREALRRILNSPNITKE